MNRTLRTVFLFILLGLASEYYFWHSQGSAAALAIMAPPLAAAQWIESKISLPPGLTDFQHELMLIFPLTLVYFGLAGFWIRQICREEGLLKYLILLAFIAFLAFLHWQAFEYLDSLLNSR